MLGLCIVEITSQTLPCVTIAKGEEPMACLFLALVVSCTPQESPSPDTNSGLCNPQVWRCADRLDLLFPKWFQENAAGSYLLRLQQCADRLDGFFPMWLRENIVPRGLDRVWARESLDAFRELIAVSCQADAAGINECLAALPKSDPRFHAAILIVLFEQRDPKYLPTIAKSLDDHRVVFEYPQGSPLSRYVQAFAGDSDSLPSHHEKETVADIAASLLGMWGYSEKRESFEQFWGARKDRPFSIRQYHLRSIACRDSATGEPDEDAIGKLKAEIAELEPPSRALVALATRFPVSEEERGVSDRWKRDMMKSMDVKTAIGLLKSPDPVIPWEPDLTPNRTNALYRDVVSALLENHNVVMSDQQLEEVMREANAIAQDCHRLIKEDRGK